MTKIGFDNKNFKYSERLLNYFECCKYGEAFKNWNEYHKKNIKKCENRHIHIHNITFVKKRERQVFYKFNLWGLYFHDVVFKDIIFEECYFNESVFFEVNCKKVIETSSLNTIFYKVKFKNVTFNKTSFKDVKFTDCEFYNCKFTESVDCNKKSYNNCDFLRSKNCFYDKKYSKNRYFQDSILKNCDFQRCHLENVSFRSAILENCIIWKPTINENTDFAHTIFGTSLIEFEEKTMKEFDIPDLLKQSEVNSIRFKNPLLGRKVRDEAWLYHYKNSRKTWFQERISELWWLTSDYGRDFWLWARLALYISLIFGFIYMYNFWDLFDVSVENMCIASTFTPFYYSIVTFTTLGFGDITPKFDSLTGQICVTIEVILGYIMLGGLISILANKLARRND